MTVAEMITEARSIFNQTDENNSTITNTQLTAWANECYRMILTRIGQLQLSEKTDLTTAASLSLDTDTLAVMEVWWYNPDVAKYNKLEMVDMNLMGYIDAEWLSADTGKPSYFVRTGQFTVKLYPPPSTTYNAQAMKIFSLEMPDALTSSGTPTLPRNLHDLFPHYMAYRAFQQLNMFDKGGSEFKFVNDSLSVQAMRSNNTKGADTKIHFTEKSAD